MIPCVRHLLAFIFFTIAQRTGVKAVQELVVYLRIRYKICLCSAMGERQRHSSELRRAYLTMSYDSHTKHKLFFHQPYEFSSFCLVLTCGLYLHVSMWILAKFSTACLWTLNACPRSKNTQDKINRTRPISTYFEQ